VIHLRKKARLEGRDKAKIPIKTSSQEGKGVRNQAKKKVSWKNQSQHPENNVNEDWLDESMPLAADPDEAMIGRNEEVVSRTFAMSYLQAMLITHTAISRSKGRPNN
jgi:hypothetical protein